MREHLVFLTGRLAEPRLRQVLESLGETPFSWEIRQMGVQVAALMTPEIIARRLGSVEGATKILLPGRVRGELEPLARAFGVPFERGPEELKDLPRHLGRKGPPPDLSRHDCRIFAEIVEAPELAVEAILARARELRAEGADVIDLGCLPGRPFPHLEEAVATLRAEGFSVSVDSGDPEELRRGARAGAAFLLSLHEGTLDLAFECEATPVLVPAHPGDLDSLVRACERLEKAGRPWLADPILDPIHLGFTDSLVRYHELRRRLPEAEMLMGVGNLTELTDADTTGVTMLLLAVCSELAIRNVLVVRVSPHCRRAVVEADRARRILFAAKSQGTPPQWIDPALLCLRDRRPFPEEPEEIAAEAAQIRDPNFRIRVARDGVHVFNRDGHHTSRDPFDLFPELGVERDAAHAFYLGYELAKAEIAFRLGKRYVQDEPLRWGCAVEQPDEDLGRHKAPGVTLAKRRGGSEA
jgi:dihydropteroate synthase-like protein